jgi:hypothetical protein
MPAAVFFIARPVVKCYVTSAWFGLAPLTLLDAEDIYK